MDWVAYTEWSSDTCHTATGDIRVWPQLRSPQLKNSRPIIVYVPPSHATTDRCFPVLYMHDGQALFDRETNPAGEWCVDETMERLVSKGMEAIIVGIPYVDRVHELSPYACSASGSEGRGEEYLAFIVDTVRPLIDASFRTRSEPPATGIAGSSMGGLISLYALIRHPDVFGLCGALSPALWFGGDRIFRDVGTAELGPCRIYLDTGTKEVDLSIEESLIAREYRSRLQRAHGAAPISDESASNLWVDDIRRFRDLLSGCLPEEAQLLYVEQEHDHSEASWAERFPGAVEFLLSAQAVP